MKSQTLRRQPQHPHIWGTEWRFSLFRLQFRNYVLLEKEAWNNIVSKLNFLQKSNIDQSSVCNLACYTLSANNKEILMKQWNWSDLRIACARCLSLSANNKEILMKQRNWSELRIACARCLSCFSKKFSFCIQCSVLPNWVVFGQTQRRFFTMVKNSG